VRLLPELGRGDWLLRTGAAAVMIVVGAVAAIVAARHAISIEPVRALRAD
jgi:ABC-type antimicrobial peptide transport system permease subunit